LSGGLGGRISSFEMCHAMPEIVLAAAGRVFGGHVT
jgi:hypothetical protein